MKKSTGRTWHKLFLLLTWENALRINFFAVFNKWQQFANLPVLPPCSVTKIKLLIASDVVAKRVHRQRATAHPTLIFWLSKIVKKSYCRNFFFKNAKFGLKTTFLEKLRVQLEFWSPIIFSHVKNLQISVGILRKFAVFVKKWLVYFL